MIERGDIFYVRIDPEMTTGHEIKKDRPCIVVSRPELCREAKVVSVVMMTTSYLQSIKDMPEHVSIRSTDKVISTAMCESVYTVDVSRLKNKAGHITQQEQQMVDTGLMIGLALHDPLKGPSQGADARKMQAQADSLREQLRICEAERGCYKALVERSLGKRKGAKR